VTVQIANLTEDVWQDKKLSTDEKAELVKRLLGKESGLVLVSTNSNLVDYVIAQISLLSRGLGVCIESDRFSHCL
jgi:hypothetical protein